MALARILLLFAGIGLATSTTARTRLNVNPIRRVVTMLQMMQKKVEQEGKTEQELFDKFMCYCKNGRAELQKSVQDAETKIPQLESNIEAGGAEKTQLTNDIAQAKADNKAAKTTMAESTALREKTAKEFAAESSEKKADISAMGKAIVSIEKGLSGFLQTPAATVLRGLAVSTDISLESRDALTSFLSEGSSSEDESDSEDPGSEQILGILKQMKETMEKDVADATKEEAESVKDFDALIAAKTKETTALTMEIETKIAREGEVSVDLVNDQDDLVSSEKTLAEDKKFLASLAASCKTKEAEWDEINKLRGEELTALADTIKLLNDDDALELFKKTLPKSSFMQMQSSSKDVMHQAKRALHSVRVRDFRLDLISMSMQGKKVDFNKVQAMIDDMVGLLKKEQVDDNKKKTYCAKSFDEAEDEKKELTRTEDDNKKTIADMKEVQATSAEEIKALEDGLAALDKSVAQATKNRKEENSVYMEELASNNAAVEIIGIAKNRMNKFYNPKLHKAAPKREMSEEDRITVNMGGTLAPTAAPGGIAGTGVEAAFTQEDDDEEVPSFVQISSRFHMKAAPPPPPETAGAYKKQTGGSGGVIAMMDTLVRELQKEIQTMKFDEKEAQADYEKFMSDSSDKRALDAKSVAEKTAAKADTAGKIQKHGEELKATVAELYANAKYERDLHTECDWLIENFETRKSARADEVDSLTKAKAVLNGADYSL